MRSLKCETVVRRRTPRVWPAVLIFWLAIGALSQAEVRLPRILSSGMVLQRNAEVTMWGRADPGEQIVVVCDWLQEAATATANDQGTWRVALRTMDAGGPHKIVFQGQNQVELNDILFGEVWLASGQSNMEMPLTKVSGAYTGIQSADKEIREADEPNIRLFQVGNFSSDVPLDDVQPGIVMYGIPAAACQWQVCSAESVAHFSSTAYFFARHLRRTLDVPIGIIDASWGGTSAEVWTPAAGLEQLGYQADLERARSAAQQADQKIPTRLYNGMIHPLRACKIKGVIWYQGEGNTGRADKYRELFSTMITQWRTVWGYEFPFYFAQLAPFQYGNTNAAFLREAQLQTLALAGTGMAVTMDIGDLHDIHPKNKQEVGRRLALWALAKDYGRPLAYSGPLYASHVVQGGQMRIRFSHVHKGLKTMDSLPPSDFEIADESRVFLPASAAIDGKDVLVSSPHVAAPVAVRYAFASDAEPNLLNESGLPASSFRTDRW